MSLETEPLENQDTASPIWLAPLTALVAWLAQIFDYIARMKRIRRTTRFKPHWRDSFADLRQLEWMREQILAAGAAHLFAGKDLYEDFDFIPSTEPPADYGGPCPTTPFEMNRRFLAIMRWNADPEAAIRKHAARIAKRDNIDLDNPLLAHGSTDAALCAAAHPKAGARCEGETLLPLMVSSAHSARPSTCRAEVQRRGNHEGQQRAPPGAAGCARGPPPASHPPNRQNSHATRARTRHCAQLSELKSFSPVSR